MVRPSSSPPPRPRSRRYPDGPYGPEPPVRRVCRGGAVASGAGQRIAEALAETGRDDRETALL
ncbi:hypothetical protein FRZ02_31210, partial [Streptomyces albidoflavus]